MPETTPPVTAGSRSAPPLILTRSALVTGLIFALLSAAVPALLTASADGYRRTVGQGARPDDVIQLVSASAALLLLLWLSLGTLVSVLAHAPGRFGIMARAASGRCAPALVRRLVAAAIGGAVLVGAAPAHAAAPTVGTPVGVMIDEPGSRGANLTEGGSWLPDPGWAREDSARTAGSATTAAPWRTGDSGSAPRKHVVASGDCLWDIAEAQLPPGAGPARIDAQWRRWYAVNRAVIGPDPSLLQPGQHLVSPAPKEHR